MRPFISADVTCDVSYDEEEQAKPVTLEAEFQLEEDHVLVSIRNRTVSLKFDADDLLAVAQAMIDIRNIRRRFIKTKTGFATHETQDSTHRVEGGTEEEDEEEEYLGGRGQPPRRAKRT